jgi:hypothetical protein
VAVSVPRRYPLRPRSPLTARVLRAAESAVASRPTNLTASSPRPPPPRRRPPPASTERRRRDPARRVGYCVCFWCRADQSPGPLDARANRSGCTPCRSRSRCTLRGPVTHRRTRSCQAAASDRARAGADHATSGRRSVPAARWVDGRRTVGRAVGAVHSAHGPCLNRTGICCFDRPGADHRHVSLG